MAKKNLSIKEFKHGLIDSVEDTALPRGASSKNLNWITQGTKIELRRGSDILGSTVSGSGRVTGLRVAKKPNGDDLLYRTRKRKIEYYDTTTEDWVEVGSNVLPTAVVATDALGEDISIEPYTNPTGAQIWFNSKNAGPWKIMTANPGSITNMYLAGSNYKGRMRIKSGRMFVWDRAGNPPNRSDLFCSRLDVKNNSDYTQISAEAIGSSGSINYTGTLAFKAGGARRICFEVTFTDGAETFADNGDGTLTGSAGGTGTINYTTGAYNINFNVAAAGSVTATYRWADDSAVVSSSGGIALFTFSATRVATEGFILKQASGGDFQNLASLNGKEYCLHKTACWVVNVGADDLDISNLIFRSKVGIPNHRAMAETGEGIYYIDDTDENEPHLRLLELSYNSTEVVPRSISRQFKIADVRVGIDLTDYRFDLAATIEYGDLILFACRTKDSATNNRVLAYNKVNKAVDVLDYYVSCFEIYNGTLVAGDSVTDNVFTLFSGTVDEDYSIANYWEGSLDNLDYSGLKRVVELTIDGEVGPEQSGKISLSLDRAPFVEVRSLTDVENDKHAIEGDGDYVDKGQRVSVGAYTLGQGEIGGGGSGLEAYHYRRTFRIPLDKFELVKIRIEATRIGYLSLTELTFSDVRLKWVRLPNKYIINR